LVIGLNDEFSNDASASWAGKPSWFPLLRLAWKRRKSRCGDNAFHVAKYAARTGRFAPCAFARRVECWLATRKNPKGARRHVRLAICCRQKPRHRQRDLRCRRG